MHPFTPGGLNSLAKDKTTGGSWPGVSQICLSSALWALANAQMCSSEMVGVSPGLLCYPPPQATPKPHPDVQPVLVCPSPPALWRRAPSPPSLARDLRRWRRSGSPSFWHDRWQAGRSFPSPFPKGAFLLVIWAIFHHRNVLI